MWIILLSALLAAGPESNPGEAEARALNVAGYRLHQAKKYPEAVAQFERSIEADPSFALAHYNLACALARLRAAGQICEHDAYRSTILEHLQEAVRLDPRRRARLRKDPDLAPVRDTFGYQRLVGRDPKDPAGFRRILEQVTWYGPAPGAYGPMSGMRFLGRGRGTGWTLVTDDEGEIRRQETRFRYEVRGLRVRITTKGADGEPTVVEGSIDETGHLRLPGFPGPFTDDPDECSA